MLTRPWLPDSGVFGIWPMIVGTGSIALLSLLFAFPISLGVSALTAVLAPVPAAGVLRKVAQWKTARPEEAAGAVCFFRLSTKEDIATNQLFFQQFL